MSQPLTPPPYKTPVGTRVIVTTEDGKKLHMTVFRVDAPGTYGVSESAGKTTHAHIQEGGFAVSWGARNDSRIVSVELAP